MERMRLVQDEYLDVECPECGKQVSTKDEECPYCGFDLDGWMTEERLEELLDEVDDDTYELKNEDRDSIIDRIKQFAPKKVEEDSDISYECPLCGAEVKDEDDKCPECGAVFET